MLFRNERDLLNSLCMATSYYPYPSDVKVTKEVIEPLTNEEKLELEKYRDKDGLLNFTQVKDYETLVRLIENVERKNALEELTCVETCDGNENNLTCDKSDDEYDIKGYMASLIEEMLPLMGLKEASISVETPEGKTDITIKEDEEPKVTYTSEGGLDAGCAEGDYTTTLTIDPVTSEVTSILDEMPAGGTEDVKPLEVFEDCECVDYRVVKLFDCTYEHNPQYYHAVRHICENEHFPDCGVYSYNDIAPEKCDIALILPTVWNKISGDDIDYFMQLMELDNTEVYIIHPENYELIKIESPIDMFDYEMTPQQEEVIYCNER